MKDPEQVRWTTEAYTWALINEDAESIREATREWIRTPDQRWFPKPGELIALAQDIEERTPITALPPVEMTYTEADYRSLLNIDRMAKEMGITLHPTTQKSIEKAHAWKAQR